MPHQIEIVEFGSIAFNNALRHASNTKKELSAVIFALQKCRPYIMAGTFTLFTDHDALTWLFKQNHTSPMLHRWMDLLLQLRFDVVHWKGKDHFIADMLSRMYMKTPYGKRIARFQLL